MTSTSLGPALSKLLLYGDIEPGSDVSYQLCKTIYTYHPIGKKLVDTPIAMAQSKGRETAVGSAPDEVIAEFQAEWKRLSCDAHIFNVATLSRIYGIASCALVSDKLAPDQPIEPNELWNLPITFNVLDPLNTAGSLVLNQNPNATDFLKWRSVSIAGTSYHPSRTVVKMHEKPIFLAYSHSAFGFVGRSVFQRCLYPLKSFVRTMITDEMVARKAGLLVAKMKAPGSIIDGVMTSLFGVKRRMLAEGETDNVLGIDIEESVEALNMNNVNGAMEVSRKNILNNIACACDMPAAIINSETFAEGFGEGSEDAMAVADYIQTVRNDLDEVYAWFDDIVMYRAWNPEFYKTIQANYPDTYRSKSYEEAFFSWKASFEPTWPPLIAEPESKRVEVEDVKLKAIIALMTVLLPVSDPVNRGILVSWCQDNFNELVELFKSPLVYDMDEFVAYQEELHEQQVEAQESMIEASNKGPTEPAPPKVKVHGDSQLRPTSEMALINKLRRRIILGITE